MKCPFGVWFSKKRFKEMERERVSLQADRDEWRAKYEAVTEDKVTCGNQAVIISTKTIDEAMHASRQSERELRAVKADLEVWKQKYADEVQKRLELIELLGDAQ